MKKITYSLVALGLLVGCGSSKYKSETTTPKKAEDTQIVDKKTHSWTTEHNSIKNSGTTQNSSNQQDNNYHQEVVVEPVKPKPLVTDTSVHVKPKPEDKTPPKADIEHNGFSYNILTSPMTGREWLDRNLGAYKVCESKDDERCYGDFFQWGRKANGHEKKDSETLDLTYNGVYDKDVQSGGKFGTWKDDWRKTKTLNPWDGADAQNNPCPSGFRIPTRSEILVETKDVDTSSFPDEELNGGDSNLKNFLKLPNNGYRKHRTRDGILELQGYSGSVWTSELESSNSMAYKFDFYPGGSSVTPTMISKGLGVRCIKDYDTSSIKPLEVEGTSPKDGGTDVKVDTRFYVTFSKQVPSSEVEYQRDRFIVKNVKTGVVAPVSIIRLVSKNKVKFTLDRYNSDRSGGLEYDSDYTLSIKDVKDISGVSMRAYSIKFHTEKKGGK